MLTPRKRIGPYTLASQIGNGAFGAVWLAERQTPIATTRVALKFPAANSIDLWQIKEEARIWVKASGHPNVLPIIEADIYDGYVVIAIEYSPDGTLKSWLDRHGGMASSVSIAVEIACGILAGLSHLHSRNIIHRDLKPTNVLLQGETPRIADFGLSGLLKNPNQKNNVAGTPVYMAPEAFEGARNFQTDIWSAGVVFYQLLTGRLPFSGSTLHELQKAIHEEAYVSLPETVPTPLRHIIRCALEKDPAKRFTSASGFRAELRAAVNNSDAIRHRLCVPAYFHPGSEWDSCIASAPKVDLMVFNPNSGPGESIDQQYVTYIARAQQKSVKVIGYVHTAYGRRELILVKEEIAKYKSWYGVNGIFVDEVSTELKNVPYYREVASFVRSRPGLLMVLNPGTFPHQEYMDVGDILCVFDGSHSDHVARQAPSWVYNYPADRFWHIVYAAPTAREMRLSVRAAAGLQAGRIYITDGTLPNPFAKLPAYWSEELAQA